MYVLITYMVGTFGNWCTNRLSPSPTSGLASNSQACQLQCSQHSSDRFVASHGTRSHFANHLDGNHKPIRHILLLKNNNPVRLLGRPGAHLRRSPNKRSGCNVESLFLLYAISVVHNTRFLDTKMFAVPLQIIISRII
jgi:hypothetical protein